MSGYIGNVPVPQAVEFRYEETATASQTDFSVGGHDVGYIDVYLNGIKLADADFTDDGSTVTLTTGATNGDIFSAIWHTVYQVVNPIEDFGLITGAVDGSDDYGSIA